MKHYQKSKVGLYGRVGFKQTRPRPDDTPERLQ